MRKDYDFTGEEIVENAETFKRDVDSLADKGFPVSAELSSNHRLVTVDTKDSKIMNALDTIKTRTRLLEDLRAAEMLTQTFGGEIRMSSGRNHWVKPKVTFEQIEQNVQDMKQGILKEVLGNGTLALFASSVRSFFGR
jgi:hypothetical protein